MSSTICSVTFCSSSSSFKTTKTPLLFSIACYNCSSLRNKTLNLPTFSSLSQLGLCQFTPWNGLRYMGVSISPHIIKDGRKTKSRGKGIYASLFGVGAPEALVIGVVALLVFGPKGLAEVARNLGKTLRAFQPTIRELQDVSKEFKNTLEREIGLDDDPPSIRDFESYNAKIAKSTPSSSVVEDFQSDAVADPNGIPSSKAYSTEEYLKITEEQLKASAALQQDGKLSESVSEPQSQPTVASSPTESALEPESQPRGLQQDDTPFPLESNVESESRGEGEATVQETTTVPSSVESPEP